MATRTQRLRATASRPPSAGAGRVAAEPSTRQRLLQAGAELFLSQGFDATALEQVRQAAQVSNGSLYHHFPTKAHLARALYLEALAHYHAELAPVLARQPAAAAGVRALVLGHIGWLLAHPQSARVLTSLRDATRIEGRLPDWSVVNAEAFGRLQAWLDAEVAAQRMRPMALGTWLALVLAPVMQLTEAWLQAPKPAVPRALQLLLADAAARAVALDAPDDAPMAR